MDMIRDISIPKVIHYCWFGPKPLPKQYMQYIETWKLKCPDFEIKEWNDKNFDYTTNQYCHEAYEVGQWAFVSDYARLKILYDYGGIYLDTDVEVLKDLTPLIKDGVGFIGFQNPYEVTTGLGFAAAPHNIVVREMLAIYDGRSFYDNDGRYNLIPCPVANTYALIKMGLKIGVDYAGTIQHLYGIKIYPEEYFDPLDENTGKLQCTANTFTVHRYSASWYSRSSRMKAKIKTLLPAWYLKYRLKRITSQNFNRLVMELKL